MTNKKNHKAFFFLIAGACCAFLYKFYKNKKKKPNDQINYALAITYYNDKKYKSALNHFNIINDKNLEIYIYLYLININLFDEMSALLNIDKIIKIYDSDYFLSLKNKTIINNFESKNTFNILKTLIEFILKRYKLNLSLNLKRDAFKDLYLLNILFKKSDEELNLKSSINKNNIDQYSLKFLNQLTLDKMKTHKFKHKISKIKLFDMINEFFIIENLINNKNFTDLKNLLNNDILKIDEICKNRENALYELINIGINFISGKYINKKEININYKDFIYNKVFIIYIKIMNNVIDINEYKFIKKLSENEIKENDDYLNEILIKKNKNAQYNFDLTLSLIVIKIFEKINLKNEMKNLLNKSIKYIENKEGKNKNYATFYNKKIISYIKENNKEVIEYIEKCISKYKDINLFCISIEFYISIKNFKRSFEIFKLMENSYKNDARTYIFKYLINKELDDSLIYMQNNQEFVENSEYLSEIFKNDKLNVFIENEYINDLDKAIVLDKNFFKTFMHYGSYYKGNIKSIKYYAKALENSTSFSEGCSSYQVLLVTEIQNEIYKEYKGIK